MKKLWGLAVETMVNRVFFTVLIGILLSTALTTWMWHGERQKTFRKTHVGRDADRIEQFVELLELIPVSSRELLVQAAPKLGLTIGPLDGPVSPSDLADESLANVLKERLGVEFAIRPAGPSAVSLRLVDGTPLTVAVQRWRGESEPGLSFWLYQLVFVLSMAVLAFLVARMTTRPLHQLAKAALDLGRNLDREPLVESGPREIRHAARAFNMMQSRLRNHVRQRNEMLAAISHDLQTPLTRLRLRLEKVDDEQLRDKLLADLSAMQALVAEGLDLARSVESQEKLVPLDLGSLLDSVCQDAVDAGHDVQLRTPENLSIQARPNDLRRCLTNLIDNAIKYGKVARVSAERVGAKILIRVADEGPGIPPEQLNKVFEPFVRLEQSRNRNTGGSGIGLTIARNIAERHGGDLTLRNRSEGGVEAILVLQSSEKTQSNG